MKKPLLTLCVFISINCYSQWVQDTLYKPTAIELIKYYLSFSGNDTTIRGWKVNCTLINSAIGEKCLFQNLVTASKKDIKHSYILWVSYDKRFLFRIEVEEYLVSEL